MPPVITLKDLMFAHVMMDSVEMVKTAQEVSSKRNKAIFDGHI